MYVCMHGCMYVCMYICKCMYMCIYYIYIFITRMLGCGCVCVEHEGLTNRFWLCFIGNIMSIQKMFHMVGRTKTKKQRGTPATSKMTSKIGLSEQLWAFHGLSVYQCLSSYFPTFFFGPWKFCGNSRKCRFLQPGSWISWISWILIPVLNLTSIRWGTHRKPYRNMVVYPTNVAMGSLIHESAKLTYK